MNTIFCIIAKSGVGKSTIVSSLLEKIPDLKRLTPITTRAMRPGEVDGVDFEFISHEDFLDRIHNGSMLEYRKYHVYVNNTEEVDNYYGHPNPTPGNNLYIMDGPWPMYLQIRKSLAKFGTHVIVYPIYVTADKVEILYRMLLRELKNENPNVHEIARRYFSDEADYPEEEIAKYCEDSTFINDDVDLCLNEISEYINRLISSKKGESNGV